MPVYTSDAEIRGYHNGNTSITRSGADYIISGDDIKALDNSERASELKDQAELTINNRKGQWTDTIRHGDRLEFVITPTEYTDVVDPSAYGVEYGVRYGGGGSGWGSGVWGGGVWGNAGTSQQRRWTGLVRKYGFDASGGQAYDLKITGEDYVYARLSFPNVHASYSDRRISHSDGGILQDLLNQYPQTRPINQSLLPDLDIRTDILRSGENLLDVVIELARRANCILAARGRALMFRPSGELQSKFEITAGDRTTISAKSNDDNLINRWRLDGGKGSDIDDTQGTVTGYQTISGNVIAQFQIDHPKSEVAKIELWTRTIDGSEDGLRVRLQKDDNGAPEDPAEKKKDLASHFIPAGILADDDWTTFNFGENDTPSANPWILVQSDGETGQEIGIDDATGTPSYRAYYSYPVDVQATNRDSQDRYIRRDGRIKDDSIESFRAGEDKVRSKLSRSHRPTKSATTEAWSRRLHQLRPGEIVTFDHPETETVGHYALVERSDSYEGATLRTDCTFQKLPPDIADDVTPPP